MLPDIHDELHDGLFEDKEGRFRYTAKAWAMLPPLTAPDILDIGCGPGGVTVRLARWSGGRVTGLDIDNDALARLTKKAQDEGLADRVTAVEGSMHDVPFPDGSFDVVWSEGSIFAIGFERGLDEWRRLLKPRGFLVVHESAWIAPDPPREIVDHWRSRAHETRTVDEYLEKISRHDYTVLGYFALPADAWWLDYYGPLEARIGELREKYAAEPAAVKALDKEQREVDLYKAHQRWYGSAFFVLQRG